MCLGTPRRGEEEEEEDEGELAVAAEAEVEVEEESLGQTLLQRRSQSRENGPP